MYKGEPAEVFEPWCTGASTWRDPDRGLAHARVQDAPRIGPLSSEATKPQLSSRIERHAHALARVGVLPRRKRLQFQRLHALHSVRTRVARCAFSTRLRLAEQLSAEQVELVGDCDIGDVARLKDAHWHGAARRDQHRVVLSQRLYHRQLPWTRLEESQMTPGDPQLSSVYPKAAASKHHIPWPSFASWRANALPRIRDSPSRQRVKLQRLHAQHAICTRVSFEARALSRCWADLFVDEVELVTDGQSTAFTSLAPSYPDSLPVTHMNKRVSPNSLHLRTPVMYHQHRMPAGDARVENSILRASNGELTS